MIELTVRLVFSLSVVLGLLFLCARVAGRRFQGRRDALVQVVHRQPIGRHASVSVVNVAGRVLVLGATDQQVQLLTELDPSEVELAPYEETLLSLGSDRPEDAGEESPVPVPQGQQVTGINGSVLSAQTWRQAWSAVTGQSS